jgi:hypothetical protein
MASGNATNAIILRRLTALEAELTALKAENASLKSSIPLAAVAAGLASASAEDVALWMEVCKTVADKYGELSAPGPAPAEATKKVKRAKKVKDPKKVTNPTGPREWNDYVFNTWIDMAEAAGVSYLAMCEGVDENDAKAVEAALGRFKKAAHEAGVTYQHAIHEASRRKDAEEGKDHEARLAEKRARKAKKTGSEPAPVTAASEDDAEAEFVASMKEAGMVPKVVDGTKFWLEEDSAKLFLYNDGGDLGEYVGIYDVDADAVITADD